VALRPAWWRWRIVVMEAHEMLHLQYRRPHVRVASATTLLADRLGAFSNVQVLRCLLSPGGLLCCAGISFALSAVASCSQSFF